MQDPIVSSGMSHRYFSEFVFFLSELLPVLRALQQLHFMEPLMKKLFFPDTMSSVLSVRLLSPLPPLLQREHLLVEPGATGGCPGAKGWLICSLTHSLSRSLAGSVPIRRRAERRTLSRLRSVSSLPSSRTASHSGIPQSGWWVLDRHTNNGDPFEACASSCCRPCRHLYVESHPGLDARSRRHGCEP